MKTQTQNKRKRTTGKPPSFGDVELKRIIVEIPKDLALKFNVYVAQNDSRLNIELAQAIEDYLAHRQPNP
ncbi:hypothetical protein KC799_11105 [candidate division KSB1 bacterium]|nr:hypothetical protein [candidate division KSB1 bacterium]